MKLVLPIALAALLPAVAQAQSRAEYYSSAALQQTADSLHRANAVSKVLGDHGTYQYVLVTRSATGGPEQHAKWTDVMIVQSGSATVLLGGRYEGSHEDSPGELRGGTLVGANAQHVSAGDLLIIPAGMPHQVQLSSGESVRYVTVKAPEK